MIIQPTKEVIVSSGSVSYSEGERAWNTVRFKKEFLQEFPQLRNRLFRTSYHAVVYHSYDLLEKEVKDIVDKKRPLPVLLFFEQELPDAKAQP